VLCQFCLYLYYYRCVTLLVCKVISAYSLIYNQLNYVSSVPCICDCWTKIPYLYWCCVVQVRKSTLSQVLNAEAYMLFYKKGVGLAKLMQDDCSSARPLSASCEFCDVYFAALL